MPELLKTLAGKERRRINFALSRLTNEKSYLAPQSIADFKKLPFGRELRLSNHRIVTLTDYGIGHMNAIVETIHQASVFGELADFSDIWTACWKTFETLLSTDQIPEDSDELIQLIHTLLAPEMCSRRFIVPLIGVKLEGIDEIPLGDMVLVRPSEAFLDAAGVNHSHASVKRIVADQHRHVLWLSGTAIGTPRVSERRFREKSGLAVAMLAVAAASMYVGGASHFRISTVMSAKEGIGSAIWFSWDEVEKNFTTHYGSNGFQQFSVTPEVLREFQDAPYASAFRVFATEKRSKLEECVTKGFYWFADAQRDPVPVMQLIKYWSCVETFFSEKNEDITRSVSAGLASVLVFGGYKFVPESEYQSLKKRIAKLYGLRSRAVHGAVHNHVSEKDSADLSQWVAWLLLNIVSLIDHGYTTPIQLATHTQRLDAKMSR